MASGSAPQPPSLLLMLLIGLGAPAFWVLVIMGAQSGEDALTGFALALGAVIAVVVVARAVRRSRARRRQRRRILEEGIMARARIVSIRTEGANEYRTRVGFELEVEPEGEQPYLVYVSERISNLAIPRVQPDTLIDVWVDPDDRQAVVLDPALVDA